MAQQDDDTIHITPDLVHELQQTLFVELCSHLHSKGLLEYGEMAKRLHNASRESYSEGNQNLGNALASIAVAFGNQDKAD